MKDYRHSQAIMIRDIHIMEDVLALKKICQYLVTTGWEHVLDNDEIGAELNLAVIRSKKYAKDIEMLAKADLDLGWGCERTDVGNGTSITKKVGDFSPYYDGDLTLKELLQSVQDLEEFLDSITPVDENVAEFCHYFDHLSNIAKVESPDTRSEFTLDTLNPKILEACQDLYDDGHYAQAILEAYKMLLNEIKTVSSIKADGKKLAERSFSGDLPVIQLNELDTESDRDEQNGFSLLYQGSALGIRNPKAHDIARQTDPYRTLEYLSLASLLMTKLDERSKVNPAKDTAVPPKPKGLNKPTPLGAAKKHETNDGKVQLSELQVLAMRIFANMGNPKMLLVSRHLGGQDVTPYGGMSDPNIMPELNEDNIDEFIANLDELVGFGVLTYEISAKGTGRYKLTKPGYDVIKEYPTLKSAA